MKKTTRRAAAITVATCLLPLATPCRADVPPPPVSPAPVRAYEYDADGNVTKITRDPGGLNLETRLSYDPLSRVKDHIDPKQGVTRFEHDGGDRTTKVTDPRNLITQYPRDGFGNAVQLIRPDTGMASRTYNEIGNLKTRRRVRRQEPARRATHALQMNTEIA